MLESSAGVKSFHRFRAGEEVFTAPYDETNPEIIQIAKGAEEAAGKGREAQLAAEREQ